ncbi:MAG: helicase [Bacteroidetes bacterium]|nr:MAG: helicase [Bacteroidota bacterium]
MIETIWGTTDKPVASSQLAKLLQGLAINGSLYIGYPIIGSPDGPFPIDALLLTPEKGAIIFHLVEGNDLGNYQELQDESYNKLQAKLLNNKKLSAGRELKVKISVVTFAPSIKRVDGFTSDVNPVCNENTLSEFITSLNWENSEYYHQLVAVIQSITNIRKGKKRRQITKPASRGAKLKKLEDSIANLDKTQASAVIETFEGVQRIRGLAGSGKTIVIALKVAYLHAQHPDWEIAVTFYTRSLKGQFEKFITSFILEQTGDEPDWEKIHIIHAWGAPGEKKQDGIYYTFCRENSIEYYDFKSAQRKFGQGNEFTGVCTEALRKTKEYKRIYDVILIDEAQDFSPNFLRLCFEMTKEPNRLIYAYDELQSLTNQSIPPPEDIFGKKEDGTPRVLFIEPVPNKAKQDIILKVCYRNSRPVLTTAHAIGFGIYRKIGLIQMFDQKELWREIGYTNKFGNIEEGKMVTLERTPETSPRFLEEHSPIEDLIQFHTFKDDDDQMEWLVNEIVTNLKTDELDPDDIVVINPNPFTTRDAVNTAREKLLELGINNNLAGISSSPDIFFESDSVTFTGVFRAKGNEAAMVYVINAHDGYSAFRGEIARVRNRLFTAITRSKAWVRVSGVGKEMEMLEEEFLKLKQNNFELNFQYPDEKERRKLNIINRDMTELDKNKIKRKRTDLKSILDSLNSGETVIEDYPQEVIKGLRKILGVK